MSLEILKFLFIGTYKKSTRISKVLDDIFVSLGEIQINRDDIFIIDSFTGIKIPEEKKIKHLKLIDRSEIEKQEKEKEDKIKKAEKKVSKQVQVMTEKEVYDAEEELIADEDVVSYEFAKAKDEDISYLEKEKVVRRDERESRKAKKKENAISPPSPAPATRSAPPPPGTGAPAKTPAVPPPPPSIPKVAEAKPEPELTVYEINMGLQYYSVMMEQRSYLFYVYFSHKELKIIDEEGKTVFKTTVTIVTAKKEPPVLDLRIEGEGFEVHPLSGKVEVKKDAVNPPVMIFSVLPVKSKKMKRKESERRFLNVYIEFENKTLSHSILSIIVQPKHFRLDIGPIHLNISKRTAYIISLISILIAGISVIYTILSIDPTSTGIDILSSFAPGLGSIVFFAVFIITLIKEGIYPLKEKISAFLNFDQAGIIQK